MAWYYSFLINGVLGFVTSTIKNPASKEQYKAILLNLRNAINQLYPGE